MTLNPSVQTRAQAELDAVVGLGTDTDMRLPTFADRERLPYINAIIKEVLRWNPSAPLGELFISRNEVIFIHRSAGSYLLWLRRLAPHGHRRRCLSRLSH